jgi:L-ascorbate metabolism protein UlaG (beta-lactamase superfamily)
VPRPGPVANRFFSVCALCVLAGLAMPSSQNAAPGAGQAFVWYLGHCGFAVRTSGHLLIFDYQETRDGQKPKVRPASPSLDNGWIETLEVRNLKVRVFVTHSHDDHYSPVIFTWKDAIPDIAYYFGWQAPVEGSFIRSFVRPRAELDAGDLTVATINSHHAGVPEVAWLVKVDGLVVYHNGDCCPSDPVAEYAFLGTKTDRIDLAFLPPVYAEGEAYTAQNVAFFKTFRVGTAFPMHVQAGDPMYFGFQKSFQDRFPGLDIRVPMRMGEKFVYDREAPAKSG